MNSDIHYTSQFENLLKQEAEKAESMSILHNKAYIKYNRLSVITNIPVIILSAIIGFLSPIELFDYQAIFLGSLSVLCGIIKTLDSYMDFTKRSNTHYMTCLNYKKISKLIQIQLSLEKASRISAKDLLTVITSDLDNIANSEPAIPQAVIIEFNKQYSGYNTAKAPICNGLTDVRINMTETRDCGIQTETMHTDEIKIEVKHNPIQKKKTFK